MNKYGRAGVALLGLVALGGLVSLLGGPNVFSTFSSSISTLFPESDAPVAETKVENTQEETPVVAEQEEQEIKTELPASQKESDPIEQKVAVVQELIEPSPKSSWVSEKPVEKSLPEQTRGPVISKPAEPALQGPKEVPQAHSKPFFNRPFKGHAWRRTPKEVFDRRYHSKAPGSTGTGKWCATVREVRELKEGEKCI